MEPEIITGPDGKVWTRSADRTTLTSEDGDKVIGNAEMSTEYLLSVAYPSDAPDGVIPADLGPLVKVETVEPLS